MAKTESTHPTTPAAVERDSRLDPAYMALRRRADAVELAATQITELIRLIEPVAVDAINEVGCQPGTGPDWALLAPSVFRSIERASVLICYAFDEEAISEKQLTECVYEGKSIAEVQHG